MVGRFVPAPKGRGAGSVPLLDARLKELRTLLEQ